MAATPSLCLVGSLRYYHERTSHAFGGETQPKHLMKSGSVLQSQLDSEDNGQETAVSVFWVATEFNKDVMRTSCRIFSRSLSINSDNVREISKLY